MSIWYKQNHRHSRQTLANLAGNGFKNVFKDLDSRFKPFNMFFSPSPSVTVGLNRTPRSFNTVTAYLSQVETIHYLTDSYALMFIIQGKVNPVAFFKGNEPVKTMHSCVSD